MWCVTYNFLINMILILLALVSSEDDIALAILRLVEVEKAVVEGAGAAGLAACVSGQLDYLKGKKYV